MTEQEYHELARAVVGLLEPYAASGKIAGFRLILAVFIGEGEVTPLVLGSHMSAEVADLLVNPDFALAADNGNDMLPPELRRKN